MLLPNHAAEYFLLPTLILHYVSCMYNAHRRKRALCHTRTTGVTSGWASVQSDRNRLCTPISYTESYNFVREQWMPWPNDTNAHACLPRYLVWVRYLKSGVNAFPASNSRSILLFKHFLSQVLYVSHVIKRFSASNATYVYLEPE